MSWTRALILVSAWIAIAAAQQMPAVQSPRGPATLQLGTPIERTIGQGQIHLYQVTAEENTLVQITVEQRGIDVVVQVLDPLGKRIAEHDSPNGADGPENVSFVANVKAPYRVQVTPLNGAPGPAGRYEIKLIELRQATEQEIKDSKNREALKARGIALLGELESLINELRLPQSRIKAQFQVAQLLWESDEKRATKYMTDAMTGFRELVTNIDPANSQYTKNFNVIANLRYEIVRVLTLRQPELALSFIRSIPRLEDPYGNQHDRAAQEAAEELEIANRLAEKDPKRALEIARENLSSRISNNLTSTIAQLRQKNPDMAAELAGEVAKKLLSDKLVKNSEAASVLLSLIQLSTPARGNPNAETGTNGSERPRALLSDQQRRELLQKAMNEALTYGPPAPHVYSQERDFAWGLLNGLHALGMDAETVANGGAASIEKRLKEFNAILNQGQPLQEFYNVVNDANKPLDEKIQLLSKAPKDQRDQLFVHLSNHVLNSGDAARARQIVNDHVNAPYQRHQAIYNLEMQEMYRSIQTGKVEEALRNIANISTPQERAQLLSQMANQIGPGYKRAAALLLLEQTRSLLPPTAQAQDQIQMQALFEITKGFARYDSKRAFEIFDPLVDQFNDISAAARTLHGFGGDFYEDEELNLQNGNSISTLAVQMTNTIGLLGISNFDRAKATAERIRLPEVRLRAYLDIAEQAIQNPR